MRAQSRALLIAAVAHRCCRAFVAVERSQLVERRARGTLGGQPEARVVINRGRGGRGRRRRGVSGRSASRVERREERVDLARPARLRHELDFGRVRVGAFL